MNLVLLLVTLLIVAALALAWQQPLRALLRYRGTRLVTCPETHRSAAVAVDASHAAMTAFVEGQTEVRLAACSRWPDRFPCDQACLADVERDGLSGTVRAVADRWYSGRTCGFCGKRIDSAGSAHAAALAGPDGVSHAWSDVSPEALPELFATERAVCWDCHVAESFRRDHPELVVDR